MAFELNVVAAGNVAVLRAIEAGGWSTRAELAQSVGKDPRNLPRDIGVLAKAGLIADAGGTALSLTDEGRAQLDAIARAEGQTTGGDLLPDERLVVHAQLRPDPDNPRKDFESDDAEESLDELRQSILLRGRLLQNLVVRADPEGLADYIVTTGNRRWHAIRQAIWDGDWPEDRPIRVVVREGTAQEHLLTAVTENMIRRSMSAIEEAEAFGDLVDVHGMKTIDISHETGLSQKVIQNRLKLLRLSDDDKERMRLPEAHPEHLGYKAALRQLTVTKEPEPTLAQLVAEHGPATLSPREPGSPDAEQVSGPSPEGRTLPQIKQNPATPGEAESGSTFEPEQPELIEATEEEKAARRRAERMAAEAASDEAALSTFVGWMRDKLAAKRAQGAHGWRNPEACKAQDIADQLVGHVAKGDPVDIAILAMMLGIKAGAMGAPSHLRSMPTPRMERLMIDARAARPVSADGPSEPDPVEDFVQEELEDEEADAGGVWTEATRAFDRDRERGGPAVPIRKSITPDFIVCLEDGRKFKSLKRHLRVKYDLTPDQYIARWALPRDYPMVAPNYAKARADLARQMGLRDA